MKSLFLIWYEDNIILNKIGLLTYDGNNYKFKYLNYENNELQLFSKNGLYYGFDDINETYTSSSMFQTILNRLPSKKREDYDELLNYYGLDNNATDFEILEKTKGKLSTDCFQFVTEEEFNKLSKTLKK